MKQRGTDDKLPEEDATSPSESVTPMQESGISKPAPSRQELLNSASPIVIERAQHRHEKIAPHQTSDAIRHKKLALQILDILIENGTFSTQSLVSEDEPDAYPNIPASVAYQLQSQEAFSLALTHAQIREHIPASIPDSDIETAFHLLGSAIQTQAEMRKLDGMMRMRSDIIEMTTPAYVPYADTNDIREVAQVERQYHLFFTYDMMFLKGAITKEPLEAIRQIQGHIMGNLQVWRVPNRAVDDQGFAVKKERGKRPQLKSDIERTMEWVQSGNLRDSEPEPELSQEQETEDPRAFGAYSRRIVKESAHDDAARTRVNAIALYMLNEMLEHGHFETLSVPDDYTAQFNIPAEANADMQGTDMRCLSITRAQLSEFKDVSDSEIHSALQLLSRAIRLSATKDYEDFRHTTFCTRAAGPEEPEDAVEFMLAFPMDMCSNKIEEHHDPRVMTDRLDNLIDEKLNEWLDPLNNPRNDKKGEYYAASENPEEPLEEGRCVIEDALDTAYKMLSKGVRDIDYSGRSH